MVSPVQRPGPYKKGIRSMNDTVKKAELFLEHLLKDSELRYRQLFDAAQDEILVLDAKTGVIENVNSYLIKMLGYAREEFVKKSSGKCGHSRILVSARMLWKHCRKVNVFAAKTCHLKQKTGGCFR